jgi:FKBP-type peptidyl-prolyl cis-trans isomerase FkpA
MLPRPRRAARLPLVLLALGAAACGGAGSAAADSAAADSARAAAERARTDSIEAELLVRVDTAIAPALGVDLAAMERRPSGLYVQDRRRGTGAAADSGQWVTVHYTTWLPDGTVLDDTRERDAPQRVQLAAGKVIKAWEEGIRGMREGGRRLVVAPPSLGYGKAGQPGAVPRLATLVFDVELVRVER